MGENLSNDSEIHKEIKDSENEAKMLIFRNKVSKNKLIKEIKNGLGDVIKQNPNIIENYNKKKKLNFLQKIRRFFSSFFKSL